jgi:serine/threonine-protein kinase
VPDWAIQRRLGFGAFGEVWLVVDRALGVERAVKLIRPDRIHDPTNFYAEPQALVELRHQHIIEVHDAGQLSDGRIYIAMEYLSDGSVEDRFGGAVVPVAQALAIVSDACRGIEFAHAKGFIHRDVKPANLLCSGNTTKVSDFGLATRASATGAASPYGYVSHCAPEVIDPGETTVRTDVYALGMTLYRLLNGDTFLPDPAQLGVSVEDAIVAGTFPDRSKFRDHIPDSIRRVVRRAIVFDPAKRTVSAAALRHDIERVMPSVSVVEVASREAGEWFGESAAHEWHAVLSRDMVGFRFKLLRRKHGGQWRKVGDQCRDFPAEASARKHARAVLQQLGGAAT